MELSRELEIKILAIIRRRKYWTRYKRILQPGFFTDDTTRHIYSLYQKYFKKYPTIPRLTVLDLKILIKSYTKNKEIKLQALGVARTIKRSQIPDPQFIEDTITEFAQRQTVKTIVMEGLNLLENEELDTKKLKEYFGQIEIIRGAINSDYVNYFEQPIGRVHEKEVRRVPTGITELDEFLRGGVEPGELMVILAPPERGKTLALVNVGYAALNSGLTVFHSTHEISPSKVASRYDLRIGGMDADEIQKYGEEFQKKLYKIRKTGGNLIIKDYSDKDAKVDDLNSALLTYTTNHQKRPDLLVVDYADLLSSSHGLRERFELKEVYTSLRRMAQHLQIPVVTASQSTRKSMSKLIITMEDFAEAFSKAHIADMVIALCQTPEEEEDGMMRIHVCKNRRRPGHPTFKVNVDSNRQAMWSLRKKGDE